MHDSNKKLASIALALALGFAILASSAGATSPQNTLSVDRWPAPDIDRELVLMGTLARVQVSGTSREMALRASSRVVEILERAASELSTWGQGSELTAFNAAPIGAFHPLSTRVSTELREAVRCAEETRGSFDPTLGAMIETWDLRGQGRHPSAEEVDRAMTKVGFTKVTSKGLDWKRTSDVIIDEGGFGKGAALDRVATWLQHSSVIQAEVDLGGQLLIYRDDQVDRSRARTVGVADPDDRASVVVEVELVDGSIATSSNSVRSKDSPDGGFGHLLDPRTGRPAFDFGSVSVWSPSALWADCLATGLFVAGPEFALDYAAAAQGVEVLVLERDGGRLKVAASSGLDGRVRIVDSNRAVFGSRFRNKKRG